MISDGDPHHGFVDSHIRLRAGRTDEVKTAATDALFAAATNFTAAHMEASAFMLPLEMRDYLPEDSALTP